MMKTKLKIKSQKSKVIILLCLILISLSGRMVSAAFTDNAFAYCRINLEKSGNQDVLGLLNEVMRKNPGNSMKNEAVLKAISMVSIKDVRVYVFPENKAGQPDYLAIINLSNKFSLEVGGRTIEFEVKDKDSLASARMAALEKLLEESLGGSSKLKSVEILRNRIFFNEEKEDKGKLASFLVMPDKVVLASSKIFIRNFIKEGAEDGKNIERFGDIAGELMPLKGGELFIDNKNSDVSKYARKIAAKKNVQVSDFWVNITKTGFSFEQMNSGQIKVGLAVKVPKEISETAKKQIQNLTEYGDVKIGKENYINGYALIFADFICKKDALDKLLVNVPAED